MYDEKPRFENQIISKKNHKIDEDENTGKKGKKHKKHHQQQNSSVAVEQPQPRPRIKEPGGNVVTPSQSNKKNQEKIFSDLCLVLSEYKQGTILKVLGETDFDKEEAYNRLLMIAPDNQKEEDDWKKELEVHQFQKKKSEDRSTSSAPSENANFIMNEVFDTLLKEDINGREFEQLFEEIAFMVKQDQKEKGVGMLEINSFVDECNIIKQTLIVGFREELSNFDDFEFDESSQLYAQIQQFIQDIIKKQVKQEKQLEEDFPSLDGGVSQQKSIIDKIKMENKYKKEQEHYFTPSKNTLPTFARERNNQMSIFNVDNNYNSEKDLISLHKEFQNVPIIDLKFIYKALAGDYNRAVEFLVKHYDSKRNRRVVQQIRTVSKEKPVAQIKKMHTAHLKEEEIDKELQHLSFQEIRNELDHLYKLRQAFQLTKMKIKNVNQRKELDRIGGQNEPFIRKLSQASRIMTIQQMVRKDPLYVDLHGFREEEVFDLLDAISRMINEQVQLGNEKIKIRMVRGRRTACLIVMTGKGLHSRGNRSILKPAVASWCAENKIDVDEEIDHLKVYIVVK